jgi:hypothetical protein
MLYYYLRRMALASILAGVVVKLHRQGHQESFVSILIKSASIRSVSAASYSRPSLINCHRSSIRELVGFCIAPPIVTTRSGISGSVSFSSPSPTFFTHDQRSMVSTRRAVAARSLTVKVGVVKKGEEDSSSGDAQTDAVPSSLSLHNSNKMTTPSKAIQTIRAVAVSPSPEPTKHTKRATYGEIGTSREEDSPRRQSPRRRASSKTKTTSTDTFITSTTTYEATKTSKRKTTAGKRRISTASSSGGAGATTPMNQSSENRIGDSTASDEDWSRPLPDFSAFAYEAVKEETISTPSPKKTTKTSKSKLSGKASTKSPTRTTKVKLETGFDEITTALKTPSPAKGKRSSSSASSSTGSISSRKKRIKREKIEPGSLTPPKDWDKIYELVQELRADRTAPVDIVGASALPETHLGPKVYRFQILVALILSSQTKDATVGEAVKTMQKVRFYKTQIPSIVLVVRRRVNLIVSQCSCVSFFA